MNRLYLMLLLVPCSGALAEPPLTPKIQLDTTFIKGNKELPQILYIVPWRDIKEGPREEHNLVLHSLYGDLFDPVYRLNDHGDDAGK